MGSRGQEDEGTMGGGGGGENEMGENGPVVSSRAAGEPVWMPFQLTRAASQRQSPSFFFFFFCSLGEHISHCLWTLMSRGWKNKEKKNTGLAFRNVTRPVRTRTEKGSESCLSCSSPFFQTVNIPQCM